MRTALKFGFAVLTLFSQTTHAQSSFNFELSLVPVTVAGLPGLHSYAYAQHDGKWLIIGGRKDGIHARQPFNAFPESQNNTDIYVVDVAGSQVTSASVNSLPVNIREQLQSTNMNFHQSGDTLYIIGGYGYSPTAADHITYPFLTTVNIPGLITAIENNQSITTHFKQIQDPVFAVTGGHLKKLKGLFFLVGGHRFDGRYNPMGNPTFTQVYTNQIRKFSINNSGSQLSIGNYSAITDPVHLRRRDFNLLPQIFPNGDEGLTISSGVFQINADLPFLYPVDITDTSYTPITNFNQYLSNYHSAVAWLYDSLNNNMHSLFFGGMSQYYYQNGTLIQDNQVPFVKTISRLTRDGNGVLTEYQMPIEMPALKGSSAEFIANLNLPHYSSKIIKLSQISQNHFLIGHIFGGINSTALNPFANNQTNLTSADNTIYEVWLTANPSSVTEFEINGNNPFDVLVSPNPFKDELNITFNLKDETEVSYFLTNASGQIVQTSENRNFSRGEHSIQIKVRDQAQSLLLTVVFDNKYYVTRKLIRE